MYTVEWCDHEGNLYQREFQTLEDAKAEAEYLARQYDGVGIKEGKQNG